MLTACRLAACGHSTSTLGYAISLQQWADHRASVEGLTSEVDAYCLAAYRNLDRARQRLLRSSWLKAHANEDPRPAAIRESPEGPSDAEDPPALSGEVKRFAEIKRVYASGMRFYRSSVNMLLGPSRVVGLIVVPMIEALPRCGRARMTNRIRTVILRVIQAWPPLGRLNPAICKAFPAL